MAKSIHSNLDLLNSARIVNSPNPTSAQDVATKAYVDSAVEGLAWKDSVRVRTASNIDLSSPGASLDGVSLSTNDRVLVAAQTSQPENGIYLWAGAASPMTRALDASTAAELEQAVTTVEEGTSAGASFRQTTVNFTLNSGNVVWTTFGTATPSASESTAGILEIATQAETNAGSDDARAITPAKLANWDGRPLKHAEDFGDNSATQYDITHNFNTRDVTVQVYRASGAFDNIVVDISRPSVNAVRLNFAVAPTTNQFRVVVHG